SPGSRLLFTRAFTGTNITRRIQEQGARSQNRSRKPNRAATVRERSVPPQSKQHTTLPYGRGSVWLPASIGLHRQIVRIKFRLARPAFAFVKRLCGGVRDFGRQRETYGARGAPVFGGGSEQQRCNFLTARLGLHIEIVEHQNPRHRERRKARIELRKP